MLSLSLVQHRRGLPVQVGEIIVEWNTTKGLCILAEELLNLVVFLALDSLKWNVSSNAKTPHFIGEITPQLIQHKAVNGDMSQSADFDRISVCQQTTLADRRLNVQVYELRCLAEGYVPFLQVLNVATPLAVVGLLIFAIGESVAIAHRLVEQFSNCLGPNPSKHPSRISLKECPRDPANQQRVPSSIHGFEKVSHRLFN